MVAHQLGYQLVAHWRRGLESVMLWCSLPARGFALVGRWVWPILRRVPALGCLVFGVLGSGVLIVILVSASVGPNGLRKNTLTDLNDALLGGDLAELINKALSQFGIGGDFGQPTAPQVIKNPEMSGLKCFITNKVESKKGYYRSPLLAPAVRRRDPSDLI